MADRGLSRLARAAGAIPTTDPNTATIRRLMGRKKPATYTPEFGGTKAPEDMVSAVMSMMQGSDAQRASLRQIFQEMPRDAKMRFLAEVAREFPRADGNPIGMSPQGEFVIDFLTGRAEMSPEQLAALQAVGREVSTGETVGPMQSSGGRGNTPDSVADAFVKADPDTPDVGGAINDELLNRSSPRNPLLESERFRQLVEAGVLIDEVPHNPPLRSPNSEIDVIPVDNQMKPVRRPTGEGRRDTALFSQERQLVIPDETTGQLRKYNPATDAERGHLARPARGTVSSSTDAQARLGNANPQIAFEQRLLDAVFNREPSSDFFMGSGKNAGVWGQVKGPNAPADPRGVFQSPREFAEYLASRIRPDAILSRSSGMDTAGAMKFKDDLAGENVARYFEGKPEVSPPEADRLAREAGLPRTGQQRLEPGLNYVVDRLEQMARQRFGDDLWSDNYDDVLQGGQQLTPDADIDVVPVAKPVDEIEEVAEKLPLVGSPEAIGGMDDALTQLAKDKSDLPEVGDLTGKKFPSGRSLDQLEKPPRTKKNTLTPEEAWQRNADNYEITKDGVPATERQIADARSASWQANAKQAYDQLGPQLGLDEMPQRTPQQIKAEMNELNSSDPDFEKRWDELTRELFASQRLAPHVHRKVNTIPGWKKEITKAANAGDIQRLEELGKQLKQILEREGKAVGPTRDKLAKFFSEKRDVAAKNYESGGRPKPEPKRATQEDLTPRPEDGAPPDDELFRRDEPNFSEPENLDGLKDTVNPDEVNEGLGGNLEAASQTEITPDDPPKQAEAASDAKKVEKSEEPARAAETQTTPEQSETPTDLIVSEDPVLVGERIPGKQDSGRTVNGKVEKPKKPKGDAESTAPKKEQRPKDTSKNKGDEPPKKPKDSDAEPPKTPEDGKKKGSLLKKGALVGGGLAAVVGAMALNRPGSARSVGQKIPLGGNPEGGGDGDGKELVAKVLGTGEGGAGSEDKSQARLIRMLQAAEKVRGFKVNPNTQTHMNWTR